MIPDSVLELIDIFEKELTEVAFPEVDAQELAALRAEVEQRAEEVKLARAKLDRARLGLDEAQEALIRKAERGLAYARVFSRDHDELEQRLDSLNFGTKASEEQPAVERAPRKKAQRSARDTRTYELPFVDDASAVLIGDLGSMTPQEPS